MGYLHKVQICTNFMNSLKNYAGLFTRLNCSFSVVIATYVNWHERWQGLFSKEHANQILGSI